jgi:proteic killer suppression protein
MQYIVIHYITSQPMIRSFKHKGLERFFKKSDHRGIPAQSAARIERMLDRLDASANPGDMDLPGFRFHALKGDRAGEFAVSVSGNWRITFRFEGEDATEVNLEDCHRGSSMRSLRSPNRRPTHPGAVLREDVLPELAITQGEFAEKLGVSRLTVSQVLHEHRALSPDLALRLEKLLGTSAESWLRMQEAVDLWDARQQPERFASIKRLPTTA